MGEAIDGGALAGTETAAGSIVASYITQDAGPPSRIQGLGQTVVVINVRGPTGSPLQKSALKITFPFKQSIEHPVGLVAFGSDHRCHFVLPASDASEVHCKVWAQLNSGPDVWIIEDSSTHGTQVQDEESLHSGRIKVVHGRRQASKGLQSINIGSSTFHFRTPISKSELRERECWFRCNTPIPVTKAMLDRQVGDDGYDLCRMDLIGEGGYAKVYRYMEKNTALYVAIKEEKTETKKHVAMVMKEISFMKKMSHPSLVDILFDDSDNQPLPMVFTAMPLYLGHLRSILPLPNIATTEGIMIQIAEGLQFMHSNLILHRDLKPDNVLVVSPGNIKIADYGWATSLRDTGSLYGVCGTTAYCAPEALYKPKEIHTPAIDVYSVACIFYSMLDLDKVNRGWVRRDFNGEEEVFNTTFENASDNPPNTFAGLIQSISSPKPEGRCSIGECIEIVKAQKYNWTKPAALMPLAAPTNLVAGHIGTQGRPNATRLQQTPFCKVRATANVPKATPLARIKMPENCLNQLIAPVKRDYKNWQPIAQKKQPTAPTPQPVPAQKPCKPAHVQGVDFTAGLPSYEEATSQNPFARLTDSREIARKRSKKPDKKHVSQAIRHSCEQAINIRRAQAAGVHKPREQLERQAATVGLQADLKKGAYDIAKGYCATAKGSWFLYRTLFGLAYKGLAVSSESIYKLFNDTPVARKALENVVPSINANARLMTSMQKHSFKATLSYGHTASSKRQRPVRDYTNQEMVDCQLMPLRRRGLTRL